MRLRKTILFIFIIAGFNLLSLGNEVRNIDSLVAQFELSTSDLARFSTLRYIETALDEVSQEEEFDYWNHLIEQCEKISYYQGIGFSYYNMAARLKDEGDYSAALECYSKSEENYKKCNYKFGLAEVENGRGILYNNLKKFDISLEHYSKAIDLFSELKDTTRVGWLYLNVGGMMFNQDSLSLSKSYLRKSQHILEELNDMDILSCYINLGVVFDLEENYDSAYYYFGKSYELSKRVEDFEAKFYASYYLGDFLYKHQEVSEATPVLMEARDIFENPNYQHQIEIGDRAKFALLLSTYYARQDDLGKAYRYLSEHIDFDKENKSDLANEEIARSQYDLLEIKRKRRDYAIAITLAGLLLTLLFLFSLYRSYKHKKRANLLLTEMDGLKTRLYSNITHELRTPLTLILSPLEQILSSDAQRIPSRKQVKMMRKNARSLLNLVNQMLDLSKIDAKSLKLELSTKNITKFLSVCFANFASLAEQRSIHYKYTVPDRREKEYFDASKLEKIINNLIANAIKFTPPNGQINCSADILKNNSLELIIEDSGKGIPQNELKKIFDRFHQVEEGIVSSNQAGTGIGLSLTKELVDLMHGKILVESEPESGSKFTIRIPLGKEHLTSQEYVLISDSAGYHPQVTEDMDIPEGDDAHKPLEYEESKAGDKAHVLIVEDHNDIRSYIAENLQDSYSIHTAENGAEGLKSAIENIPDLVITDVAMPEMEGTELCEKLKTDERTSHVPVIMLTAKSGIKDKMKGLETGADVYLTKPFHIKELHVRVEKLIEQREKLRERFTKNLRLEPKDIAVSSADGKFIERAMEVIETNMGNSDFEVRQFQEEMFMSRMQLFRKIKALTNQTPGEFIRTIRLKRAASLLEQKFGNIAQVSLEVGFNNPSYFAKCFQEYYGVLPSDYLKKT